MSSRASTIALLLLASSTIGCTSDEERFGQELDALVAENDAALRATEQRIQASVAASRASPALTPIVLPAGAPPIDARRMLPSSIDENPGCNTVALFEDLRLDGPTLDEAVLARAGFYPQYEAGEVLALVDGHRPPYQGDYMHEMVVTETREAIARVIAVRYAFICRTLAYVALPPATEPYRPGSYSGECRAYDLASSTYLGGLAISAATHDMETVWVGGTAGSAYSQLEERMRDTLVAQVDAALAPLGSPPQAIWFAWR